MLDASLTSDIAWLLLPMKQSRKRKIKINIIRYIYSIVYTNVGATTQAIMCFFLFKFWWGMERCVSSGKWTNWILYAFLIEQRAFVLTLGSGHYLRQGAVKFRKSHCVHSNSMSPLSHRPPWPLTTPLICGPMVQPWGSAVSHLFPAILAAFTAAFQHQLASFVADLALDWADLDGFRQGRHRLSGPSEKGKRALSRSQKRAG